MQYQHNAITLTKGNLKALIKKWQQNGSQWSSSKDDNKRKAAAAINVHTKVITADATMERTVSVCAS